MRFRAVLVGAVAIVALGAAYPAYAATSAWRGDEARPYIITLNDNVGGDAGALTRTAKALSGAKGNVGEVYTGVFKGFSATLPDAVARSLRANPAVVSVDPDDKAAVGGTQVNPEWGLDRVDQRQLPLNRSFTYPTTASNVSVYVLDTGVRIAHTEFEGRAVNGYDFVDRDQKAQDCNGHGTHVAGTIAGKTYGVAKKTKILAVRVLDCAGSGSYSQIIAGIDWVVGQHRRFGGPTVINMSLGGPAHSTLNRAVQRAVEAGVTVVVAAGNNNGDACTKSPASEPTAITVGNSTPTDTRYTGNGASNFGSCLDIWAPGTGVRSAYNSSNKATAVMTGTSMASPHVAGAVALVLSTHPKWTPAQVSQHLNNTATTGLLTGINNSPNRLLYVG